MSPSPRRPTVLASATAALLALPLALGATSSAAAAAPAGASAPVGTPTLAEQDPAALSRAVRAAFEEASASTAFSARGQGPGRPAPSGPDRRALDAAVRTIVDEGAVGVTARVESPRLRWAGAAGSRQLDRRPTAHTGDRFEVGSITKPMIATLVMQEVEKGTWQLDTPVEDVLPGVLGGRAEVTLEHLLSHRSGLPTGSDVMVALRMTDLTSWDEFIRVLGEEYTDTEHVAAALATPWLFEPGTDWSYSNAGYIVLGMMLEEVTGQDLDALLRHRVTRPAGMRHTELPHEPRSHGPFLVGAAFTGPDTGWYSLGHGDPDLFGAAGAVTSTTADLMSFTDALLGGRLVRPDTVADMVTPRSLTPLEYGLGVFRVADPCAPPGSGAYLYGHNGATYGTLSIVLSSPDGARSLAVGVTGRDLTSEKSVEDFNALLLPMALATC
ncbi:serine hydrolase domain-containing protein [Cellulomonas xiejunii]|uniref:serine hydrolase domain-containing protein n=1 Tax=Cellulomonas xiejunii TaxID=2968083 RepID=UPI001D0E8663|nr:serine hydrolase domain-containing protein [Cellulomonas xiejunii]MCC2315524.1 beta-lactamase family protein [Cellulomonas xiejunii]